MSHVHNNPKRLKLSRQKNCNQRHQKFKSNEKQTVDLQSDSNDDEPCSEESRFSSACHMQEESVCGNNKEHRGRTRQQRPSVSMKKKRSDISRLGSNSFSRNSLEPNDITYNHSKNMKGCSLGHKTAQSMNEIHTPEAKHERQQKKKEKRRHSSAFRASLNDDNPLAIAEQQQQNSPFSKRNITQKRNKTFSFGSPARQQREEKDDNMDRLSNHTRRKFKTANKKEHSTGLAVGSLGMVVPKLKQIRADVGSALFGNASMETRRSRKNALSQESDAGGLVMKNIHGGGNIIPIPGQNAQSDMVCDGGETAEHEVVEIDSDGSQEHRLQNQIDKGFGGGKSGNKELINESDHSQQSHQSQQNLVLDVSDNETDNDGHSGERTVKESKSKRDHELFEGQGELADNSFNNQNDDAEVMSASDYSDSIQKNRKGICGTPPQSSIDHHNSSFYQTNSGDTATKFIFEDWIESSSKNEEEHGGNTRNKKRNRSTNMQTESADESPSNEEDEVEMLFSPIRSGHHGGKPYTTPESSPPAMPRYKKIIHGGIRNAPNDRKPTAAAGNHGFGFSKANGKSSRKKKKVKKGKLIVPGEAIQSSKLENFDDIESFTTATPPSSQEEHPIYQKSPRFQSTNNHKEQHQRMSDSCRGSTPYQGQKSPFQGESKNQTYRSTEVDPSRFHRKKTQPDFRSTENQKSGTKVPAGKKSVMQQQNISTKLLEVINIDSSDSEDDLSEAHLSNNGDQVRNDAHESIDQKHSKRVWAPGNSYELDATRIAFGKKIFSSGCKLSVLPGGTNPRLVIEYKKMTSSYGAQVNKDIPAQRVTHNISIHDNSIIEMHYFLARDEESDSEIEANPTVAINKAEETFSRESEKKSNVKRERADSSPENEQMSFLAMRVTPTEENELDMFSDVYNHSTEAADDTEKYIIVELRSNDEFKEVLERMKSSLSGLLSEVVGYLETDKFLTALKEDYKKAYQKRNSTPQRTIRTRSSTRKKAANTSSNDVLLVYPFTSDTTILEDATQGLKEANGAYLYSKEDSDNQMDISDSSQGAENTDTSISKEDSSKKVTGRNHYLTIRGEDMDRLEPGEFLNDTLIDFWMRWIWREEIHDSDSVVHFFTSHFFTTLKEEGSGAVSSWTAKKKINIFQKRLVFIPINESLHWSLCVVVNPGSINCDRNELPCIIFLDSLRAHRKAKVAKCVREWLNSEWARSSQDEQGEKPFNRETMPVYDPKIPYQDNSWDCGVFVCRYAYGLFQRRHRPFTRDDLDNCRLSEKAITKSEEFQFDMVDIARLREEMKTLLERLSAIYIKTKQKERRERKARAGKRSVASSSI